MPFEPRLVPADDPPEAHISAADATDRVEARCPNCGAAVPAAEGRRDARTADEESELPVHLAALADQLRDDADHLVGCYPAAESADRSRATAVATARERRWVRWSAAAAVLLIVATWPSVAERLATVEPSGSSAVSSKQSIAQVERGENSRAASGAIQKGEHGIAFQPSQEVEEVGVGVDAPSRPRRPPADEVEMLRIQINGFEKVIERLQAELSARDQSQADMVKLIKSLQDEIATLKGQGAGSQGQRTADKGLPAHGATLVPSTTK
jgi:hypothetical protein